MKKLLFTTILCSFVVLAFGQKRVLKTVKDELKNEKPNFGDARANINAALEHPETKDLAETWFIAGSVENAQFEGESKKEFIQQTPDHKVMYGTLGKTLPFFEKAYELDQVPDAKGKVKPKFTKDIKSIVTANRLYYINGGAYYFEEKEFETAYNFFQTYLSYPTMEMFKNDADVATKFPNDSMYIQIKYYAAISASQMNDSEKAIAAYESLKNDNYNGNEVYQFLCYEYERTKDTVRLVSTLAEGVEKFPEEPYYLLSLINQYIYAKKYDEAIEYINRAINKNATDPQLFNIMGIIYENRKDNEAAANYFQKAIEMDADFVDAIGNLGRIYFNEALEDQSKANEISDNQAYKVATEKVKEKFQKALPYFEKAHRMKSDEKDYMMALRGIYYNLNMGDKFDEIEAKLGYSSAE